MEEVDEFKVITEQERFREKKKIIEKHRHIEDSLQSKQLQKNYRLVKKESLDMQQKALEVDRKMQKLLEYHEKQLEREKEEQLRKVVNKMPLKSDIKKAEALKALMK